MSTRAGAAVDRTRISLSALTPGLGTGAPAKVQHARVLGGAAADPGAVHPSSGGGGDLAAGGIGTVEPNGGAATPRVHRAVDAVVTERCSPTLVRSSPVGA